MKEFKINHITDELDKLGMTICRDYCKYTEILDAEISLKGIEVNESETYQKYCENCPLNILWGE